MVAKIVGVHRTRVSNWMRPKHAGGTGGSIPQKHHRTILSACREAGMAISAENLLPSEDAVSQKAAVEKPTGTQHGGSESDAMEKAS